MSTQSGKASKEKLAEARAEQKELLEDLCDIEDELDTKLGVFRVSVEGIQGPTKLNNGDTYELQLKLSNQKWKARCRVEKHQQMWQDNEIMFIGRIADELSIKLVEVKKIQADSSIGNAKWRTREMLSFCPQAVKVIFQSHSGTVHLTMNVRWSPTIEDNFLAELDLPTVELVVGGSKRRVRRTSSHSGAQRVNGETSEGKISTGTLSSRSGSLLSVKKAVELEEDHRKWAEEQSRAFRKATSESSVQKSSPKHDRVVNGSVHPNGGSPHSERSGAKLSHPVIKKNVSASVIIEEGSSSSSPQLSNSKRKTSGPPPVAHSSPPREGSYSGSIGKRYSYEAAISLSSTPSNDYPDSLVSAIEAVSQSLEEPKVVYADLRALEFQLLRLEGCLRGAKIRRSDSMTLSESVAIDSFSFLTIDDHPTDPSSHPSSVEGVSLMEGVSSLPREQTSSRENSIEGGVRQVTNVDSMGELSEPMDRPMYTGSQTGDSAFSSEGDDLKLLSTATTGVEAIDRALTQHLIYSDHLLQDLLQLSLGASSPLNHKLKQSLSKLRKEAEIIKDMLNMAADVYSPPNLEEVLPELAVNKDLFAFWKDTANNENLLCVNCDTFLVAVDRKWGADIWTNFPDVANKVFLVLLSRILDLDNESGDLADTRMVVTVFQFSAYFLEEVQHGDMQGHIVNLATELQFTEGASSQEPKIRFQTAQRITQSVFNKGAILSVAMLLKEDNPSIKALCVSYLDKLMMTPSWHRDSIVYCMELLENTDQAVRKGACYMLGRFRAVESVPHLKYMAKVDFPEIQAAAYKALGQLGYGPNPSSGGSKKKSSSKNKTRELMDEAPVSMRSKSAPAVARLRSNRTSAPVLDSGHDLHSLRTTHV